MEQGAGPVRGWTFLTNHARVLVQIARDPAVRVRDIAAACLLTERAVSRIIADLEEGGYLAHHRVGRTNHYQVTAAIPLRHPADAGPTVADLLSLLAVRGPLADGRAAAAATVGTTRADTSRPAVTVADTTRPDTTRPDTVRPDTTRPDTSRAGAATSAA